MYIGVRKMILGAVGSIRRCLWTNVREIKYACANDIRDQVAMEV